MKVLIILQARMNSSRLPGKILAPIEGLPSIIYQIKRIRPILNEDIGLVVATTNTPKDDELCTLLDEHSIKFYRGDENNAEGRQVPGYFLLNASAEYTITRSNGMNSVFFIEGRNLFNENYETGGILAENEVDGTGGSGTFVTPGQPTTIFAGVHVRW